MTEYKSILERVKSLRERLAIESKKAVSALQIEQAADVFFRERNSKSSLDEADAEDEDPALNPPRSKRRKVVSKTQ